MFKNLPKAAKLFLIGTLACAAFSLPAQGADLEDIYNFNSASAGGFAPFASLIQAPNGNFYGTTMKGGPSGTGTVFQMTPAGAVTTLYNFKTGSGVGWFPSAALLYVNGALYGTTTQGGSTYDAGSLFRLSLNGHLTVLGTFNGTNGADPSAPLVQGDNGKLYGTTSLGGPSLKGNIFTWDPVNGLKSLYTFSGPDGSGPMGLIKAADGNFYGTTQLGGNLSDCGGNGCGTFFKISPSGVLTTLAVFSSANQGPIEPAGPLAIGDDGNFYGPANSGGSSTNCSDGWASNTGCGAVIRLSPTGEVTTLYSFSYFPGLLNFVNGPNSTFYASEYDGVAYGYGNIVSITQSGEITTLATFDANNGWAPLTPVIGTDGNLYGTTYIGGIACSATSFGCGTIYKVTLP